MQPKPKEQGQNSKFQDQDQDQDQFYVLPEGCISTAISLTTPRDACRLATVSTLFKSAADSDTVWECFLPSDYAEILARSDGGLGLELLDSLNKRRLFFYLADHRLLLDDSSKCFFLDKSTGIKCFAISAKELSITWSDTPRYWAFHSLPESRFPEVAELLSVCWLEIKGRMKSSTLSPNTTYSAYLVFKMAEAAYGFYSPAQVTLNTPGGKTSTQKVYLQYEGNNLRNQIPRRRMVLFNRIRTPLPEAPPPPNMLPLDRQDGWLELEIGEFFTQEGEDGDIEMSVMEVAGNWKKGLIIEGIEIRPKTVSD